MARTLSGIQASGRPHIGNYFGAIGPHIEASKSDAGDDAFFFVADYHALTTVTDRAVLLENTRGVAATYFALGLDDKACFFRQSDVPEVCELTWFLSCASGMGFLERAVSYKDKLENGLKPNVGLFTYPILMAADILIYDAEVVPVGKDQIQHVEMAQDMAQYFNNRFGCEVLKRPEWKLAKESKVPGVDGKKMSKSYNNTLWIFEEGKKLKKATGKIVTDSKLPSDPKNPDDVNAYVLLELFLSEDEKVEWREKISAGGENAPGYGDMKKALASKMDERFGDARVRFHHLMENPQEMEERLQENGARARKIARGVLDRCRHATGISDQPLPA